MDPSTAAAQRDLEVKKRKLHRTQSGTIIKAEEILEELKKLQHSAQEAEKQPDEKDKPPKP